VHSPVGLPFVLGSRRVSQHRLPLLTSPRRTSNLSLSCTRHILFCHTTPKHTLRSPFSQYPPTPGSRFVSYTRSRSLTVAISVRSTVVLRLCLKFGLVGGGGGVCSSYDVGPGPTLLTVPCIRHARTRIRGCRTLSEFRSHHPHLISASQARSRWDSYLVW